MPACQCTRFPLSTTAINQSILWFVLSGSRLVCHLFDETYFDPVRIENCKKFVIVYQRALRPCVYYVLDQKKIVSGRIIIPKIQAGCPYVES